MYARVRSLIRTLYVCRLYAGPFLYVQVKNGMNPSKKQNVVFLTN